MRSSAYLGLVFMLIAGLRPLHAETVAELKARAEQAHGGELAKLYLEIAQRELEEADAFFTKGEVEKAQGEVQDVVEFARKAATTASSSGKRLKQTEIGLRGLSKRMHDIGDTLAFDDRAPLKTGVEQIEQARSDLLNRMFAK